MGRDRVRIKICGFTRNEDLTKAVKLGIDAAGFVFYPPSDRFVTVETACSLCAGLPPFVSRVGVFVDADPFQVVRTVSRLGLHAVQLHGEEPPEYLIRLRDMLHGGAHVDCPGDDSDSRAVLRGVQLIKAIRMGDDVGPGLLTPFIETADAFLLDTYREGRPGGTGATFRWDRVRELRGNRHLPIILAGGLHADNVHRAVELVQPYAVDVSSGVEEKPGRKCAQKMERFIQQVLRGAPC